MRIGLGARLFEAVERVLVAALVTNDQAQVVPIAMVLRLELRRFRQRLSALRDRIDQYNEQNGLPNRRLRVDAYYGQRVVEEEQDEQIEQTT